MIFKSGKQRRFEKGQKAAAEKARKIQSLRWLAVVCLLLPALGTAPSVAMILFIILAVVMVPVPYVQRLWSRIPIKWKWFKPAVLITVFFIAVCLMPDTVSENTGGAPEVPLSSVTETVTETETTADTEVTAETGPVVETVAEDIIKESASVVSSAQSALLTDPPEYSGSA